MPSSEIIENPGDSIDRSISEIMVIDIGAYSSDSLDINPELNVSYPEAIQKIIQDEYLDLENIPQIEHNYEMQIQLTSNIPISFRPRRLSYADKQIVDKTVDELLKQDKIRPSNSPYAFPLVLASKKDGTKRMCVEYKPINKIMIRNNYPLPLIDDCLERLEGMNYFTTIDLINGFQHIRMAEDSIQYTSFVTPSGQYEYLFMPSGFKNGPGTFQRFMNWVLADFIREGSVVTFSDDITLATKTIQEHSELLKRVLRRLAEFRLEMKESKCKFCHSKIDIHGFTVSNRGARPNGHPEMLTM